MIGTSRKLIKKYANSIATIAVIVGMLALVTTAFACPSGTCGVGHGLPMPDPARTSIDTSLSSLCSAALLGPGLQTDGNCNPTDPFQRSTVDVSPGSYMFWDANGRYYEFTDSDFTSGNGTVVLSDGDKLTRSVNATTQLYDFLLTYSDGSIYVFTAPSGSVPDGYTDRMIKATDPNGRTMTYNRDSNGLLTSVVTPEGRTWGYVCESEYGRITKATAPDGTYTVIAYNSEGSGSAENKVASITRYDASNNQTDQFLYQYDATSGNLTQASQGSKVLTYTYSTDSSGNSLITATETSATPNVVTVFNYGGSGSDTTLVTRKHSSDSSKDETSTYKFFMCSGARSYEYSRTLPDGGTVTYSRYVPTGVTLNSQNQNDCVTSDNVNLYSKAFMITDALGNQTNYNYDPNSGNMLAATFADGSTETYTYYPGTSLVRSQKNVAGNYTYFAADPANPSHPTAIKVSTPVNGQEPTNWNAIPEIYDIAYYSTADPHGQGGLMQQLSVPGIDGSVPYTKTLSYFETVNGAEKHRLLPTSITTPYWSNNSYSASSRLISYDEMNRVVSLTDANNRAMQMSYDAYGHRTQTTFAQGVSQQAGYDCCNLLWTQDENGHQVHNVYDSDKRLTTVWTDVPGQSVSTPLVSYTYDCFGNLASSTSYSNGTSPRTTSYVYDKNNRLTQVNFPSPLGYQAYGYDLEGNRQWVQDGNGNVTLYRYDNLNRVTDAFYRFTGSLTQPITYPARSADVSYSYVAGSKLVSTVTERDSTGSNILRTSAFAYDAQDRLISYTPPAPSGHAAVAYTYNNLSQKTSITSSGYSAAYQYYANGTLKGITFNGKPITNYTFDPVGNRTTLNFGNFTWEMFTYDSDARYRLHDTTYGYACNDSTPAPLPPAGSGGMRTIRDGVGNPTWWGTIDGSYSRSYTYDQVNMLAQETYANQTPVTDQYDWVGNRLTIPGVAFNPADEIVQQTGHAYAYDGIGNMVTDNLTNYTFTPSNLPSTMKVGGANPSVLTWDAAMNRIGFTSSTDPSNPYAFVYDPTTKTPAMIEEDHAGSSVYYICEPNGSVVARVAGGMTQYYGFDDQGSAIFLTGDNGTVTDKYMYDAWGNQAFHTGTTQQPFQYVGRFGYYTHYQDSGLAPMIQAGIRLYDPRPGRFVQPDIYVRADDGSPYAYVQDEPTKRIDPSGKFWCIIIPQFPFIECHPGRHPVPPVLPPSDPTPTPCPPRTPSPGAPGSGPGGGGPGTGPGVPLPGIGIGLNVQNCIQKAMAAGVPYYRAWSWCHMLNNIGCEDGWALCSSLTYPESEYCEILWDEACNSGL